MIDLSSHRTGRPPKLSPEIRRSLMKYARQGQYISVACEASGICYGTYNNWLNKAKRVEEYRISNDIEDINDVDKMSIPNDIRDNIVYYDLFNDLKREQAKFVTEKHQDISKAGKGNWIADITLLERVRPDLYGRRSAMDDIATNINDLTQELLKALHKPDPPKYIECDTQDMIPKICDGQVDPS